MKKRIRNKTYKRTNYKRRRRMQLYTRIGSMIMLLFLLAFGIIKILDLDFLSNHYFEKTGDDIDASRPDLDVDLLTVNEYSRPGKEISRIQGIVVHYTANPGSTAKQNRDYFEGLKDSHVTKASSHFIVGLKGEIVQCIPTWEVAYASNDRNNDTISIETCHMKEDGKYTRRTYKSLVELTAWLCKKFGLDENDVIRHYDVTGKICPRYFVEDEEAWEKFKKDVKKQLK